MQNQSISLYFSEGSSDKEYHAELTAKDGGFVVNFRYGRRGSALKTGTKTASPLPYAKALGIYEKLVAEKVGKGYSTGEAGAAYQDTPLEARFSGCLPQLANAIDETQLIERLTSDDWAAQEKFDGKRCLIRKNGGKVEGINRKGLVVALPQTLADWALGLDASQFLFDGELVGERFHVFDILEYEGRDLREQSFTSRDETLATLAAKWRGPATLVRSAWGTEAKRALFDKVKGANGEGLVFKEVRSRYVPGRPASAGTWLKWKFKAHATCRVESVNGSKRSVSIELFDEKKLPQNVGKVSIPPNARMPAPGALIEVEYLYAYRGGSLFQPIYKGERDDLEAEAAVMSQLKYKPDSSEDDEEART